MVGGILTEIFVQIIRKQRRSLSRRFTSAKKQPECDEKGWSAGNLCKQQYSDNMQFEQKQSKCKRKQRLFEYVSRVLKESVTKSECEIDEL